jgi:hypothetical protein
MLVVRADNSFDYRLRKLCRLRVYVPLSGLEAGPRTGQFWLAFRHSSGSGGLRRPIERLGFSRPTAKLGCPPKKSVTAKANTPDHELHPESAIINKSVCDLPAPPLSSLISPSASPDCVL